jgi:multisubunit Na+/H+ antiporter MnhB subunit
MGWIIWMVVGVILAVALFLFFPNLFSFVVTMVKSFVDWVLSFIDTHNMTNLTGA